MVPRYLRRSSSIDALAAFAYLKGIAERDVSSVLEVVLGDIRRLAELEAESTAYVICQALGLDTSDYSFGYVVN